MGAATKVGICTDSNSQIPAELVDRYDVEVVPITVIVDEHEYLEGVDLDADGFYALFRSAIVETGHAPKVSTSQPSPGQFALAYEALAERGCTDILSIHISSAVSGTLNSARLATRSVDIPIRLVDTGTTSFGVSCCVWAAGDAIFGGATLDEAASIAESLGPSIGNVFIVGGLDLMSSTASGSADPIDTANSIPVLTFRDGRVEVLERVVTVVDAINSMASVALRWGDRLNVAVGVADGDALPLADALAHAVGESANVDRVVRYRVGPSVGARTGPGSVGCFMFPSSLVRSTPATS
jgi:DegV family protein with EDD domain